MESPQQAEEMSNDESVAWHDESAAWHDESAAWLADVHELIAALQGTPVREVEISWGDTTVFLRRRPDVAPHAPAAVPRAPAAEKPRPAAIQAPLNGIFYDRPSPDAAPFVQVGDRIEAGQVVAIIEAMKVFNEVHAERAGRVTALLVESGDMVENGQDLIALDEESGDPAP